MGRGARIGQSRLNQGNPSDQNNRRSGESRNPGNHPENNGLATESSGFRLSPERRYNVLKPQGKDDTALFHLHCVQADLGQFLVPSQIAADADTAHNYAVA